jgi:predicted amidohydrolase
MGSMKVAAIQHDITWEEPERTREHVIPLIAGAAADGARLIVLPEMFATGFSMRPERIAEDEGGPTEQFLLAQAAEHDVYVIASIAQRGADGQFRNNAIVATSHGVAARYAKIHPFTFAGEAEHYAAGDSFATVDIDGLRVTVFVCYDLRFADEFWLTGVDTDVFVVPANWPSPRHEHWNILLRARAIENQAYVIGVNRVGLAKDLPHSGGSLIVDPAGTVLAEGTDQEGFFTADVCAEAVVEIRTKFPFLADRRAFSGNRMSRAY